MPAAADTFWHLRAGGICAPAPCRAWKTHLFTAAGWPWRDHEWLWQPISWRVSSFGGMPLLAVWGDVRGRGPGAGPPVDGGAGADAVCPALIGLPLTIPSGRCGRSCSRAGRPAPGDAARAIALADPAVVRRVDMHGAVALGGIIPAPRPPSRCCAGGSIARPRIGGALSSSRSSRPWPPPPAR
jgi:hypothetical protein